jgi:hypothetical protein
MKTAPQMWMTAASLISLVFIGCGPNESGESRAEKIGGTNVVPAVLLFNGTGTSPNDVAAFEKILRTKNVTYAKANSAQLNRMSEAELREYRVLLFPGGNFEKIGNNVSSNATANIRSAVQNGCNYLGVCAGAFFAGNSPYNGLNLTSGVRFPFYSAEERGIRKAAVQVSLPNGPALEHYWEDGPQLNGWGEVVGKYPDGTAAIAEGKVGSGRVILSGVHPEAPENWRKGMNFKTPSSEDHEFAWTLIEAALNSTPLPHY